MTEMNIIYNMAKQYGYRVEERFGDIYIKTQFESWRFHPSNGKTTLYHQGYCSSFQQDYHKEFTEYVTAKQIMRYIHEHEVAKYTKNRVTFTVFQKKVPGRKMVLA